MAKPREVDEVAFDEDVDAAIDELAIKLKMTRQEVIRIIVRDWFIANGKLRPDELEEDSKTEGSA